MKKLLFFLTLFPVLASGQLGINLDPSSLGSLNILLGITGGSGIFVSQDNTTGVETGTFIYPYNTIQEGLGVATSGDVVIVLEPVSGEPYREHLVMSTDSVRLMTLEGQTVRVELQSSGAIGLDIDANGLIIGGGSGMGFTISCDAGLMIVFDADRSDVEISHNTIVVDDGGTIGINVGAAGSTRLKVLNNLFVVSSGQGGFYAVKTLKDVEIIGNEFQGADSTSGYAIQMSGFLDGIIADNYIHKGATVAGGFASGIFPHTNTTDPHSSDSLEIYNNIVQNCSNGIRLGHSNGADMKEIYVYNNIIQHNQKGIFVHNDAQVFPATYDVYDNNFSDNTHNILNDHATPLNYGPNNFDYQGVFADGAVGTPGISFANLTNGGLYRDGNDVKLSTTGVNRVSFLSNANIQFATNVYSSGTSTHDLGLTTRFWRNLYIDDIFVGDDDTGIGSDPDTLYLNAGGVEGIRMAEGSGDIIVTINGALAASGTLSGETGVTLDTDPTVVLAVTDCRNHARFNNDADVIDYTLPAAEAGLVVVFYDIGGGVITIDPVDGTDTIYLNGTSVGAGDEIDSPGAVGDFICLMAIDATRWVTVGRSGVWVDANP